MWRSLTIYIGTTCLCLLVPDVHVLALFVCILMVWVSMQRLLCWPFLCLHMSAWIIVLCSLIHQSEEAYCLLCFTLHLHEYTALCSRSDSMEFSDFKIYDLVSALGLCTESSPLLWAERETISGNQSRAKGRKWQWQFQSLPCKTLPLHIDGFTCLSPSKHTIASNIILISEAGLCNGSHDSNIPILHAQRAHLSSPRTLATLLFGSVAWYSAFY